MRLIKHPVSYFVFTTNCISVWQCRWSMSLHCYFQNSKSHRYICYSFFWYICCLLSLLYSRLFHSYPELALFKAYTCTFPLKDSSFGLNCIFTDKTFLFDFRILYPFTDNTLLLICGSDNIWRVLTMRQNVSICNLSTLYCNKGNLFHFIHSLFSAFFKKNLKVFDRMLTYFDQK